MRHDLRASGREVIQLLVDSHREWRSRAQSPGEELVYVTEGSIEYALDGRPPVTLKPAMSCSSRRNDPRRRKTSAPATPRSSPATSSKKESPRLTLAE